MSTEWCDACGGQGFLDEEAASRFGLALIEGRTMVCPACDGSGEPAGRDPRGCALALILGALAWALLGAVAYLAFHR